MSAEIIQFVPRSNPKREAFCPEFVGSIMRADRSQPEASFSSGEKLLDWLGCYPTDCGNLGHPWSGEDKA